MVLSENIWFVLYLVLIAYIPSWCTFVPKSEFVFILSVFLHCSYPLLSVSSPVNIHTYPFCVFSFLYSLLLEYTFVCIHSSLYLILVYIYLLQSVTTSCLHVTIPCIHIFTPVCVSFLSKFCIYVYSCLYILLVYIYTYSMGRGKVNRGGR